MFGLIVLVIIGLYLLISVGVVRWAIGYARANGKSAKRWGWGAALIMYLLVFWDWIPTVVAHQYYCSTEAGFWVYKTPEQWIKENPGVMETLVHERISSDYSINKTKDGFDTTYTLNQRMKVLNKITQVLPLLEVRRKEDLIMDGKTSYTLTRRLSFESGRTSGAPNKFSDFKFWINAKECKGEVGNTTPKTWGNSESIFRNMGEEK